MIITYFNSRDDLSSFVGKKIIFKLPNDGVNYAGILSRQKNYKYGDSPVVFLSNCPYCFEIDTKKEKFAHKASSFRTFLFVGKGIRDCGLLAGKYSEDPDFIEEWNNTLEDNINSFSSRLDELLSRSR